MKYSLYERVKDAIEDFMYKIFGVFDFFRYDLPQGLRNLWVFRKVIWRWRCWDAEYTDAFLLEALKEMSKCWEKCHYVDCEEDKKLIDELAKSIEQGINDSFGLDYETEYLAKERKEVYKKFGEKLLWD